MIGIWEAKDGSVIFFDDDGYYYFDIEFMSEEGTYEIGRSTSDNSFEIDLSGNITTLMKYIYVSVPDNYHFEIYHSGNDKISLVQVNDSGIAATSGCRPDFAGGNPEDYRCDDPEDEYDDYDDDCYDDYDGWDDYSDGSGERFD